MKFLTKDVRGGFTLVEIMIVVAIIALLAAIAVPGFLRARKRSQAVRVLEDLRLIDHARYRIDRSHNCFQNSGSGECFRGARSIVCCRPANAGRRHFE